MSRSRPAANPISYHKHTKQYYVTRAGKRVYLGSDKDEALKKYHRLSLGFELPEEPPKLPVKISVVELANWRDAKGTLRCYRDWLGRFIKDHPRLKAADFTFEMFADWKVSLKNRGYSAESVM